MVQKIWITILLCITSLRAGVLQVPSEYATIQSAIDSAVQDDTVLVAPGNYVENLLVYQKTITLASHYLIDQDTLHIQNTIIDGDSLDHVLHLYHENTGDTTHVIGLTFQNGFAQGIGSEDKGGGILSETPLYLSHCQILNSSADDFGGGIFSRYRLHMEYTVVAGNRTGRKGGGLALQTDATIRHCVIQNNISTYTAGEGGGVDVRNPSIINIQHTIIADNCASWGGGISIYQGQVTIDNVEVRENVATSGGGMITLGSEVTITSSLFENNSSSSMGAGLRIEESYLTMRQTTIEGNQSAYNGGGLYLSRPRSTLLNEVVFRDNESFQGGGLSAYRGAPVVVNHVLFDANHATQDGGGAHTFLNDAVFTHCTFVDNDSDSFGGGQFVMGGLVRNINNIYWENTPTSVELYLWANETSNAMISHSIVQGGYDSIEQSNNATLFWLDGNKDEDPLFLDPGSNFALNPGSPALDAGVPFLVWEGDTLLDLDDTAYTGIAPDMGAFESPSPTPVEIETPITDLKLRDVYPNPFNSSLGIDFSLDKKRKVVLQVFDLKGKVIHQRSFGELRAGEYQKHWDAKEQPTGVYFIVLKAGDIQKTRKAVLVK